MSRTKTADREIVEIAGERWARVDGTMDGLESVDSPVIKYCRRDTLEREIQRRAVEQRRTEAARRATAQAQARLDAQPVEVIGGVEYQAHPDDDAIVIAVSSGSAFGRRRVQELAAERAQQEARDQRRHDLYDAVAPDALRAKLAELEQLIAEARNPTQNGE